MKIKRGQTILEYVVIMIVILGCLLAMQNYIKRGIQGRWKASVDEMGEQYDPNSVNANIVYRTQGDSNSQVTVQNDLRSGQWTVRNDFSNMVETKSGSQQVGN